MLKKGDIILLIFILIAGVIISLVNMPGSKNSDTSNIAVVKQGDNIIDTIYLDSIDESERITISGNYNAVILAENGRIRFEKSDCPDKLCVKTGWLTDKGDVAVCLPNRIIVKIEGVKEEIDGGTY